MAGGGNLDHDFPVHHGRLDHLEVDLMSEVESEIAGLKAKIKELEQENREIVDSSLETLSAGYEQALTDIQHITHGVMEVTWAAGPVEGLGLLLRRLQEKDVPTDSPLGVPHDWLSRWKVELKSDC